MATRVFLSYNFHDKDAANIFHSLLSKCPDCEVYYYDSVRHEGEWPDEVGEAIRECDYFCAIMGKELGTTQEKELAFFEEARKESQEDKHLIYVELKGCCKRKVSLPISTMGPVPVKSVRDDDVYGAALKLCEGHLGLTIDYGDDLPLKAHQFDYEKTVISFYKMSRDLARAANDEIIPSDEDIQRFLEDFLPKDEFNQLRETDRGTKLRRIRRVIHDKHAAGCPPSWPRVELKKGDIDNLLSDIGGFRPNDAEVLVAALTRFHEHACMYRDHLTFPEAGPRKKLLYPQYNRNTFRVAILVSGGIAPGVNAVIDGITSRHYKYYRKECEEYARDLRQNPNKLEIWGLKNGFRAFDSIADSHCLLVDEEGHRGNGECICTSNFIDDGGSIIGTSRDEALLHGPERGKNLEHVAKQLMDNDIRILYIIGGDGSMKAAHAISSIAKQIPKKKRNRNWDLTVVGVPKTMDNDILWVWQTFGFMSAVEKARELIADLYTEVKSNPRLGIVQLFGSDSGFVVSHAVLSSKAKVCDVALIPEVRFSMKKLIKVIRDSFEGKRERYGLVVLSETAIPTDAMDYLNDPEKAKYVDLNDGEKKAIKDFVADRDKGIRFQGQTNDALRSAGLKIVSGGMKEIDDELRVLTNEPRHILRAISPSTGDIIFGNRLGTLSVDNAMAGYSDFMISQWLTEFVLVPLKLVVAGRKRIPNNGVFWKSVLAKTGQPENMDD